MKRRGKKRGHGTKAGIAASDDGPGFVAVSVKPESRAHGREDIFSEKSHSSRLH